MDSAIARMYPTLLLLRQSLELALKEVLRWWQPGHPGNHHNLLRLWEEVDQVTPDFSRRDGDWLLAKDQVLLWHRVDPSGMAFRYPDVRARYRCKASTDGSRSSLTLLTRLM